MCMGGKPKAPKIPDPAPLRQPEREPDVPLTRRKTQSGPRTAGGTLLTGSGGILNTSLNTGANTLLGG